MDKANSDSEGRSISFNEVQRKIFIENGMDLRMSVLHASLILESLIKSALVQQGVKTDRNFNDRIEQLIGLDLLKKGEKEVFTWFMDIRNQFVHNIDAPTMKRCLDFTKGVNAKRILKRFPAASTNDEETDLMNSVELLKMELSRIVKDLVRRTLKKHVEQQMQPSE